MIDRTIAAARSAAQDLRRGGYRQVLRWVALPVTNRRWAAPLSALALGFGLFVGVAIGPSAAGTLATGAQIIEIPLLGGGAAGDGGDGSGGGSAVPAAPAGGDTGGGSASSGSALPTFSPFAASGSTSPSPRPSGQSPSDSTPPPTDDSTPQKQTLTGAVLHVNPAAGSYTIAVVGGELDSIHSGKLPDPGTKVSVPIRQLSNQTYAEAGTREKSGIQTRATFNGIVTFVDSSPTAPAYTVSKRGVSALVHVHPDPSGAPPTLPALGAYATVAVDIQKAPDPATSGATATSAADPAAPPPTTPADPPATQPAPTSAPATPPSCAADPNQPAPTPITPAATLWQRQVKADGAPFTYGDFEGIVEAVCADTGQLLVSADDIREDAKDILFSIPPGVVATKVQIGESVLVTANIGADGSLALTGLASDERTKGADDLSQAQGDLAGSKAK